MFTRLLAASAVALMPFASATAQPHPGRTAWLREHVSPIRSVDITDTNYSDLAPLGRAIGSRRIVLLGEQGHGDGTTFEAKARVIRYLHQRLGFDLLVFESGFYDCRRTWKDARAGLSLADSAANCMFELWSNSAQVGPLLSYLDAQKSSGRPLELAGMDFQPSGRRASILLEDLARFLHAQRDTAGNDAIVTALTNSYGQMFGGVAGPSALSAADRQKLMDAAQDAARAMTTRPLHDVPDLGALGEHQFWRRTVQGIGAFLGMMRAMSEAPRGTLPPAGVMNRRDSVMGENLAWLAERNPGRRIVVWGATSHFVRDRTGIEGDPAPQMIPAGHVASTRMPGQVYSIAFLGVEGSQGVARRGAAPPTAVPSADSSSLDGLLRETGLDYGFLDLRSIPRGGEWLNAPLVARPLGYAAMRTVWPRHIDGVFYIRRMNPSRPIVTSGR